MTVAPIRRTKECEMCLAPIETWRVYCDPCQVKIFRTAMLIKYPERLVFGKVYAVGVIGDSGSLVKFGYTVSPAARLSDLQIGSPAKLEYLAICSGSRNDEIRVHKLLAEYREHGEWFARSVETAMVIEAMRANALRELLAGAPIKDLRQQENRCTIPMEG